MSRHRFSFFWIIFVPQLLLLIFSPTLAHDSQPPLRILLSNDDGVESSGLAALFDKLSQMAAVTVVAPLHEISAIGHALTLENPIVVHEMEKCGSKWYAVEAFPASCIKLGLDLLIETKPDLVVSGINRGDNLGLMTFSSGTVACAREAAAKDIPAVAISLEDGEAMDYRAAAEFMADLIQEMRKKGFKTGRYLNVNYPALPQDLIKGVLVVRQDIRPYPDYEYRKYNLEGKFYIWHVFHTIQAGPEKTDAWALRNGYIAITPLQLDQTDPGALEAMAGWKIVKRQRETLLEAE